MSTTQTTEKGYYVEVKENEEGEEYTVLFSPSGDEIESQWGESTIADFGGTIAKHEAQTTEKAEAHTAEQSAKHTPGPWRIDCMSAARGLEIKGANGNTVVVEEDYFVFPDEMRNQEEVANELAANARLIAAAPELLDFVKAIVQMTEGPAQIDKRSVIEPGVTIQRKARQLVLKAEKGAQ